MQREVHGFQIAANCSNAAEGWQRPEPSRYAPMDDHEDPVDADTLPARSPIQARFPPGETGPTTGIAFVVGALDVGGTGTTEDRLDPGPHPVSRSRPGRSVDSRSRFAGSVAAHLPEVWRHQILPDDLCDDGCRASTELGGQLLDGQTVLESGADDCTILVGPGKT